MLRSVAPTVEEQDDGTTPCDFELGGTISVTSGLLDVSAGHGYLLGPILLNNLVSRTSSVTNSGAQNGELQLTGAIDIQLNLTSEIAADFDASSDLSRSYVVRTGSDSMGPGDELLLPLEVLPGEYAVDLATALAGAAPTDRFLSSLDIVFHATRAGNSRGNIGVIDSRVYNFPVQLCNGCARTSCGGDYLTTCDRAQDPMLTTALDCSGNMPVGTTGVPPTTGDAMTSSSGDPGSTGGGMLTDGPGTGPMATGS